MVCNHTHTTTSSYPLNTSVFIYSAIYCIYKYIYITLSDITLKGVAVCFYAFLTDKIYSLPHVRHTCEHED